MSRFILVLLAAVVMAALAAIPTFAAPVDPAVLDAVRNFTHNLPADWFQMKPDVLRTKQNLGEQIFVLDVRRRDEFAAGHLEGAVNIPVHEIADHLDLLPEDPSTVILVYCRSGVRSTFATSALLVMGYETVYNMPGGYLAWVEAGYPVVR
jgi:rhodanese-related sulfurtransferase